MKAATIVLAGSLLLSAATADAAAPGDSLRPLYLPGPYAGTNAPVVCRQFTLCLETGIAPVQESVLGHVVWLRLVRPDAAMDDLRPAIDRLMTEGATRSIRYRASLASAVLDAPELFASLATRPFDTADDLFIDVARALQKNTLGAR
jgi:hypothetical protein